MRVVLAAEAISAGRMWVTHFFRTTEPLLQALQQLLPCQSMDAMLSSFRKTAMPALIGTTDRPQLHVSLDPMA